MVSSLTVPINDWLHVLDRVYLRDFVAGGGAAVKFLAPRSGLQPKDVVAKLQQAADDRGYAFADVSSSSAKVHLMQEVFHSVARQVDWNSTATEFIRNSLEEVKLRLPPENGSLLIEDLARLNNYDVSDIRDRANNILRDKLFQNYSMTQEFRVAMLVLCRTVLEPVGMDANLGGAVRDWLTGELRLASVLKPAHIYRRIGRANARGLLYSIPHWLKLAGKPGLFICINVSSFSISKRPIEENRSGYFTNSQVMEAYEVLRQLIDSTDELNYCVVAVVLPEDPEFEVHERRGLEAYQALKLRVAADVVVENTVNPFGIFLRLSASTAGAG
ncbi:MAG: DUF2791 family P-loop domain-containing protein [Verrucomicrobia bacterium]|nr:DUF2791 family P-loop domain-containing protein [Verrucomicrobiota bacterium]